MRKWLATAAALLVSTSAAAQWSYKPLVDRMSDYKGRTATVVSVNAHTFHPPWGSGVRMGLTIWDDSPDDDDITLRISKVQFGCYTSCSVTVRFDDRPASEFAVTRAGDGSHDVIFIDQTVEFVKNLRSASRVLIQATFHRDGERVFEFKTAGLKWPKMPAESKGE